MTPGYLLRSLGAILCLLAGTLLLSCERAYDYSYQMANATDSSIQVHVTTYRLDSVFVIQPGKNQLLFITDHGVEGSQGPFYEDVDQAIRAIVVKQDTLFSKKDYRSNDWWMYHDGTYQAVVSKNDF